MTDQVTSGSTEEVVDTTTTETTQNAETTNSTETLVTKTEEAPKPWIADDWREKIAGDDVKALERLKRFPDVQSVWKSYKEIETKFSSGQHKAPLPENASEEQIAAYRKENGIPEKAEDYEFNLADGVVIGEDDHPFLQYMLDKMHAANAPTKTVEAMVNGYMQMRAEQVSQVSEQQKAIRAEAEDKLREEWPGGQYKDNLGAIRNMLAGAPDGLADMLMTARLPDGSLLGNNYNAIKWLAQQALELNPAATVVPSSSGNQMESIQDKISEYEAKMKANPKAWHKDLDTKKKYMELLDARIKLQARGH